MDERERRLADNEILFRTVNEQIERLADSLGRRDDAYDFVCECANTGCTAKIPMTLAEYEEVRAHAARFAMAKGHALPDLDRVVERHERYEVVEKDEGAAQLAETRDPRS